MNYSYNQFINDVLDDAHSLELKEFKPSVFQKINRLLGIDCGRWLTRTSIEENYHLSGMYLYNLSEGRDRIIRPKFQNRDFLYNAIAANQGTAIDAAELMDDDQWFSSDVYLDMCKDYGIDRAVSIIVPCEYTGVYNGMGFYRTGKENRFSEQERQQIENIAHFLSRVLRLCLFRNLKNENNIHGVHNCAIVDHLGRIVDSTPLFKSCVTSLIGEPFVGLPNTWFVPDHLPQTYVLNNAKFSISHLQDLYLVVLNSITVFDKFTEKEKVVAELITQGLSNKEIAKNLNVSHYTVGDYAKEIGKKCGGNFGQGTTGRAKLISFLFGQASK